MPRKSNKRKRNPDGTMAATNTPNDSRENSSPLLGFTFDEQVVAYDSPNDAQYMPEDEDKESDEAMNTIDLEEESDEQDIDL
jgi:hypothetical protein